MVSENSAMHVAAARSASRVRVGELVGCATQCTIRSVGLVDDRERALAARPPNLVLVAMAFPDGTPSFVFDEAIDQNNAKHASRE